MKISVFFSFALLCIFFTLTQSKNSKDKRSNDKQNGNGKQNGNNEQNGNDKQNGNGWKIGKWKKFLVQYGYASSGKNSPSPQEIKLAVTKLRILYQFDNTTTDEDITRFMELPRCGNKDIKEKKDKNSKRVRRYDLNPAWRKPSFTYAFEKYSSDLTVQQQDSIAAQAFLLWKDSVPQLDFTHTQNSAEADIKFSFEINAHTGCAQAFDGTGPILAHAYYPEDGRVHFDDDELFTDQSSQGRNLYSVLVHEIGHALGLGHSFVSGAAMHPVYQGYNGGLALHDNDINGMRSLYAPNTASDPTCVDQDPSLCALYNAEGYCSPDYADVMIETCPQTCNLCQ